MISEGPYSGISAEEVGYEPSAWLHVSREIRLHHECAHVVCRRTMPTDLLPVWDEITANVVGLLRATGSYDASLATRFLGVTDQGYAGGRLEEYLDPDQRDELDIVAREVHAACQEIERLSRGIDASDAFDFLLELKRAPLLSY